MELDPNAIYKAKFRELTELLGRTPTSRDSGWLELHREYSSSWQPAEETVKAPKARETQCGAQECVPGTNNQTGGTPAVNVAKSSCVTDAVNPGPTTTTTPETKLGLVASDSAAGPVEEGFSRKPAPQARAEGAVARESVPDLMANLEASLADARAFLTAKGALSGPGINESGEGDRTEPEASLSPGANYEGLLEGDRGPGGGLMAICVACGRLWERPAKRGRPSFRCPTCRG